MIVQDIDKIRNVLPVLSLSHHCVPLQFQSTNCKARTDTEACSAQGTNHDQVNQVDHCLLCPVNPQVNNREHCKAAIAGVC